MTNNITNPSNYKEEKFVNSREENARVLNNLKAENFTESSENKSVQAICSEETKYVTPNNSPKTEDNNVCSDLSKKNESNTKHKQFKVRLSFCLGYGDKEENSKHCTVPPNEPKQFLIFRRSQILLMLLVFAYHCHAEFLIVFSFNPPQEVPCFSKEDELHLQLPNVSFNHCTEKYRCNLNKTIVNKCCPLKQSFVSNHNLTCTDDNTITEFTPFNGKVFSKLHQGQDLMDIQLQKISDIKIIPAQFNKESHHRILEGDSYLMEDGVLLTEKLIYHHSRSFCSEFTIENNTTVVVKFIKGPFRYFVGDVNDTLIWFCLTPLSILALSMVIGLYVSQPQLRNLHGEMLICYLLSQVGFYITTTVHKFPAKHSFFSYFFNYTLQFSILAQHCWMSALCFDVWLEFSRPLRRPGEQKPYSFLLYSVCCWGCATLLCLSTAAVGVVPHVSDSCPKPRFEQDACFFTRRRTADLFFNTPMALALSFNLVMFLSTVVNIRFLHVEKGFLNQPSAEGGLLYLKLSLLMGINWVLVWVGFRVEAMLVYLYIRAIISIQGVVLAVVLVSNKRIWNIIRKLECKKHKLAVRKK